VSSYISAELRQLVAVRAKHRCEYCLIREEDTFFGCEVDHIISVKHGGTTVEDNLAYACMTCNRRKGSDLGSIPRPTGELVRFFNPRTDKWADHFEANDEWLKPLTEIGEVTVRIFGFNTMERILERGELIALGRYP
jgi:5-methylcytosine-specific restriction endonuclease McrA